MLWVVGVQDTPRTGSDYPDTEDAETGAETEGEGGGGTGRPPPPPDPDEDPNTPAVTPMSSAVNTAFDALSLNKAMVDTLCVRGALRTGRRAFHSHQL